MLACTPADTASLSRSAAVRGGGSTGLSGNLHEQDPELLQVRFQRSRRSSKVRFGVYIWTSVFPSLTLGCRQLLSLWEAAEWQRAERGPGVCACGRWRKRLLGNEVRFGSAQSSSATQVHKPFCECEGALSNLTCTRVQETRLGCRSSRFYQRRLRQSWKWKAAKGRGGKAIFPGCLAGGQTQHSWITVTDGI